MCFTYVLINYFDFLFDMDLIKFKFTLKKYNPHYISGRKHTTLQYEPITTTRYLFLFLQWEKYKHVLINLS